MEREKFDKMLSEALSRTQPAMPEHMTERFMERMCKEKVTVQPVRRRFSLWHTSAIVAAAAAVLLLIFIPIRTEEPASDNLSLSIPGNMPMPVKKEVAMVVEEKSAPAAAPSVAAPAKPAGRAKPKAVKLLAQVAPSDEQQGSISETAVADTSGHTAPAEAIAEKEKEPSAPVFTPQELELIALAEKKKAHVRMYLAEIQQSVLIEQREREYELLREAEEEKVITNV